MFDVITIAGSPSSSSRSAAVLEYTRQVIVRHGFRTRALNVRDLPPEDLVYGRVDSLAILEWVSLLNQARAVIIATPVYKAAYSGVLKAFLDLLPPQVLAGKLVLPIATGGSPAHMLAIDYALRPVIGALGAQHVLQGVYVTDSQIQLGNGVIQLDPTIEARLSSALQYLVDRLGADTTNEGALQELAERAA